jgi:hypothetical protein
MSKDNKTKQEILKQGMKGDFWKILVDALEDSVTNLRGIQDSEDLMELSADQYKVESELLKAKIKYSKRLQKMPEDLISWYEDPENKKEEFDPYREEDA